MRRTASASVGLRKPAASRQTAADRRLILGASAVVGFVFHIPPSRLLKPTRGSGAEAEVRQTMLAVVRRAKAQTDDPSSIQRLGRSLGRDRTTVAHALHKIESACEEDEPLDALVDRLASIVRDLLILETLAHEYMSTAVEAAQMAAPKANRRA